MKFSGPNSRMVCFYNELGSITECVLCSSGLVKAPLKRSRSTADGADEDSQEQLQEQLLESGGPEEEQKTDNTSLLRLLEEGEKVRERRACTHDWIINRIIYSVSPKPV